MATSSKKLSYRFTGNRNDFKPVWSQATHTWGLIMTGDVAILEDKDGRKRAFIPGDHFHVVAGKIVKISR